MTTNKILTHSVHDALNRCLEELTTDARIVLAKQNGIKAKRRALNKEMRGLKELELALLANFEVLSEINIVLADAVVTADKEAKQTPADGVVSICAPFPPRDPLGGTIVPSTEVDPLGR